MQEGFFGHLGYPERAADGQKTQGKLGR